jgi:hypothetical protein
MMATRVKILNYQDLTNAYCRTGFPLGPNQPQMRALSPWLNVRFATSACFGSE